VRRSLLETCIRRRAVHTGRAVDFFADQVRLPNGKRAVREYLGHPGAVAVVPFIDPETILLVRQYRYPIKTVTLELPAGKLSKGEAPLRCARRELREETGCTAGRIRKLLRFWPASAFSNELLHIYAAGRLRQGRPHPDEDEFVETVRVPFSKALAWVRSGKLRDSKTIIGLLACALPVGTAPAAHPFDFRRRRGRGR